jgi:hypothetical protein
VRVRVGGVWSVKLIWSTELPPRATSAEASLVSGSLCVSIFCARCSSHIIIIIKNPGLSGLFRTLCTVYFGQSGQ